MWVPKIKNINTKFLETKIESSEIKLCRKRTNLKGLNQDNLDQKKIYFEKQKNRKNHLEKYGSSVQKIFTKEIT